MAHPRACGEETEKSAESRIVARQLVIAILFGQRLTATEYLYYSFKLRRLHPPLEH